MADLIDQRLGRGVAEAFLDGVLSGPIGIEIVTRRDVEHATRIMRALPDQAFPLVDCTSFSVMERRGIETVATLDVHFSIYGPARRRAFRLVP